MLCRPASCRSSADICCGELKPEISKSERCLRSTGIHCLLRGFLRQMFFCLLFVRSPSLLHGLVALMLHSHPAIVSNAAALICQLCDLVKENEPRISFSPEATSVDGWHIALTTAWRHV